MSSNFAEEPRRPRSTVRVRFVDDSQTDLAIPRHLGGQPPRSAGRKKGDRYRASRRSPEPTAILTKNGPKPLSISNEESPRRSWRLLRKGSRKSALPAEVDDQDVSSVLEGCHIETPRKVDRPNSALYEGDESVISEMFSFPSTRRKSSMIQKATESIPKSNEAPEASSSKKSLVTKFSTPYCTRRNKFKREIFEESTRQQLNELADDLDSDYMPSESSQSEESSDEMSVLNKDAIGKPIPRKNFEESSRRRTREKISDISFQATEYFERQGLKSVSSNHTLSKLKSEKFCRRELHKLLKKVKHSHAQALQDLKNDNLGNFRRWMIALSEGYNVLLYGVGSKYEILKQFHNEFLQSKKITVFVLGFFPGLVIQKIFADIAEILCSGPFSNDPREAIEEIEHLLGYKTCDHLFILVNNIDGEVLRGDKIQSVLAELAALSKVHVIATCDHINAPLLWDQKKLSLFNFIWEDVTSFIPYTIETSYENSRMIENPADMALASLRNVFRSLNNNSKNIFKVLLDYQLKEGRSKNYHGMSFSDLYQTCRNDFIVSSDLVLRTQLTEFLDHELIKWKKDTDQFVILVDIAALEQFQTEIQSS